MTVQRCPSCGRAWDGALCFACGFEAGKGGAPTTQQKAPVVVPSAAPPASSPPPVAAPPPAAPAPLPSLPLPSSANPFGRAAPAAPAPGPLGGPPSFAPLPALPPLGRPPTASGVLGVGGPPRAPTGAFPGAFPPSPPAAPSAPPVFPPSTGAVPSFTASSATGSFQQPPSFQPPAFSPPSFEPPAGRPATPPIVAPVVAPPPASPGPVGPRPAVLSPPRPRPAASPDPRPEPPATPAAVVAGLDEHTVDVERAPQPPLRRAWRKLYGSPAVFGAAFVVGFLLTFGPGAAIFLGGPSVAELAEAGRHDEVIAILKGREAEQAMEPGDWLLYGHSLAEHGGLLQRAAVLDKYAQAVRVKVVDANALGYTIDALGDDKARTRAMVILEDWPANPDEKALDPDTQLLAAVTSTSFLRRHAALDVLKKRILEKQLLATAAAAVAYADVKSRSCEDDAVKVGLEAIREIADGDKASARAALAAHNPTQMLLDMGPAELAKLKCVSSKDVERARTAVAAVMR